MAEKVTLTEEQREWRSDMAAAFDLLREAVVDINGPYKQTRNALSLLDSASACAIPAEDLGPCEGCGDSIWSDADEDTCVMTDDGTFCRDCVARWNEAAE